MKLQNLQLRKHLFFSNIVILMGLLSVFLQLAIAYSGENEQSGALYIRTSPHRAEIRIDGQVVGVSPCTVKNLPAKSVLITAERSGFHKAEKTVEVLPDEIQTVDMDLRPKERVGHLLVLAKPIGASVLLDADSVGLSPLRLSNLLAGEYELTVKKDGYVTSTDTVTVDSGRYHEIRFELQQDPQATVTQKEDAESEVVSGKDKAKYDTDQTNEKDVEDAAAFFEPIRTLIKERRYDESISKFKELREKGGFSDAELEYIHNAKRIVDAGYEALKDRTGEENYPLPLRQGGSITGELIDVGESNVLIDTGSIRREIPLADIHIDRILRLAARRFPPHRPQNRLKQAYLYILEEEFQRGENAIDWVDNRGHDTSFIKSILEREKLAARKINQQQHLSEDEVEKDEKKQERVLEDMEEDSKHDGKTLLIDLHFGTNLPDNVMQLMEKVGYNIISAYSPFTAEELSDADVYILNSRTRMPAPYEDAIVDSLISFIRNGGSVVLFANKPSEYSSEERTAIPFLNMLNMDLETDELIISSVAPPSHPTDTLPARRVRQHVILAGISGYIPFPLDATPILSAGNPILQGSEFVRARGKGISEIPLLIAGMLDDGKVAVFASLPDTSHEERGEAAIDLILNAVRWASIK